MRSYLHCNSHTLFVLASHIKLYIWIVVSSGNMTMLFKITVRKDVQNLTQNSLKCLNHSYSISLVGQSDCSKDGLWYCGHVLDYIWTATNHFWFRGLSFRKSSDTPRMIKLVWFERQKQCSKVLRNVLFLEYQVLHISSYYF